MGYRLTKKVSHRTFTRIPYEKTASSSLTIRMYYTFEYIPIEDLRFAANNFETQFLNEND